MQKIHEKKKIRSEFEFIGLIDNRLKYKCKECNDISYKSVDDLIKKFPITYKLFNGFAIKKRCLSLWIYG